MRSTERPAAVSAANVPYWLDTTLRPPVRDASELKQEVDVVVVGGGLTGMSAALTLARAGAGVTVLERNEVGSGASGRNGGMCTTGLTIGFGLAVKRYGEESASQLYQAYNEAIDHVESIVESEGIDCSWKRTGKFNLAAKPSHYDGLRRTQQALKEIVGQETELVPREEIHTEIGSDFYHGGLLDPLGAGVHVGRLVNGIADAAERMGADIHERTPAIGFDSSAKSPGFVVTTPKGTIRSRNLIVGTNGYTDGLVPWLRRRIAAVGSFIIVTEPLSRDMCDELLPNRRMASDSRNLIYYFRITPDDRLLFGGRARFALSGPESDRKSAGVLEKGMRDVFPQMAGVTIDYAWGGLVGFALDRIPHAGYRDGFHYATAFGGHGVQMATYMGHQIANSILGRPAQNPWEDFSFRPIPGHFGRPWFLPLAGAYYRAKDFLM